VSREEAIEYGVSKQEGVANGHDSSVEKAIDHAGE
jgi:hypothetical protein